MNKLKKYLSKQRGRPTVIASSLGVSTITLYNWGAGKTKPRVDQAIKLEKLTVGAVTVLSWK
jgi:hypothetical protein